jgi:hypothetical protein
VRCYTSTMKFLPWLIVFLISGCAFQRLAVTQLDNLIEIETASKLDLYRAQKKTLEADVTVLLESQKPHLETLTNLVNKIDPTNTALFPELWTEISVEYRRIALAFSALLAKHLVTLAPKQRDHFFAKMESDNKKILAKNEAQDVESLSKRVSFFFGETSPAQEKVLERNLPEVKRRTLARLNRRKNLHKTLDEIISSKAFAADKERLILAAFESYQRDAGMAQEPVVKMMQDLCRELTPEQIATFNDKRKEALELITLFKQTEF